MICWKTSSVSILLLLGFTITADLPTVSITGDQGATMQYSQYIQRIVKVHRVGIVGWTHTTFASPSCLSEGESGIQKLFNAVLDGSCKFIKFSTDEERDAHIREHEAAIKSGAMVLIPKKSKAKGKGKAKQSEVIDDEDGELMDTA